MTLDHIRIIAALVLSVLVTRAIAGPSNLCLENETAYFSCQTRGKHLSVCGSKNLSQVKGYLQYRFGKGGSSPELEFPTTKIHPSRQFEFSALGFGAKSSGSNLRFFVGDYAYVVYFLTSATEPSEVAGVAYRKGNDSWHYTACKNVLSDHSTFQEISTLALPPVPERDFVFGP